MKHLTVTLLDSYKKYREEGGDYNLIDYLSLKRGFEGEFKVVPEIVKDNEKFDFFAESMIGNSWLTCVANRADGKQVDMLFYRDNNGEVGVKASGVLKGIKSIVIDVGGLE